MRIGTKVRVAECSGIDSGRVGVIIPRTDVRVDGRGIPELPGFYRRPNWSRESAILLEDSTVTIMSNNRIVKCEAKEAVRALARQSALRG